MVAIKVFDTTKSACVLSGVVTACTMQKFAHQSSWRYLRNSDNLLSQINNRAIALQVLHILNIHIHAHTQMIPAFVHIIS